MTYTYELRGIPAYIFACIALPIAAVLFLALGLALVVGIPLFFLVWGVVELWHRAAKKLRGYRRAKAPTWRDRKASKDFIRR